MLQLRPAGLAPRFYAFAIDLLIRLSLLYAVTIAATVMGGIGLALWFILIFALEWLYPVVFELTPSGATPGKRVMGLKVVMDSGLPITPAASLTRNLLRAADFLPLLYGFAVVSVLVRRDFKRLGDLAAATLVVYRLKPASSVAFGDFDPRAPAMSIAPHDQAAVIALAARAPRLTRDRLDELAALAAPISGDTGKSGPEVTLRVLAVAHWLLGRS